MKTLSQGTCEIAVMSNYHEDTLSRYVWDFSHVSLSWRHCLKVRVRLLSCLVIMKTLSQGTCEIALMSRYHEDTVSRYVWDCSHVSLSWRHRLKVRVRLLSCLIIMKTLSQGTCEIALMSRYHEDTLNPFASGIKKVLLYPITGLFSVKIRKIFLAIKNFSVNDTMSGQPNKRLIHWHF